MSKPARAICVFLENEDAWRAVCDSLPKRYDVEPFELKIVGAPDDYPAIAVVFEPKKSLTFKLVVRTRCVSFDLLQMVCLAFKQSQPELFTTFLHWLQTCQTEGQSQEILSLLELHDQRTNPTHEAAVVEAATGVPPCSTPASAVALLPATPTPAAPTPATPTSAAPLAISPALRAWMDGIGANVFALAQVLIETRAISEAAYTVKVEASRATMARWVADAKAETRQKISRAVAGADAVLGDIFKDPPAS